MKFRLVVPLGIEEPPAVKCPAQTEVDRESEAFPIVVERHRLPKLEWK